MSELPFIKFTLIETELNEKANRGRKASQETAPHRGVRGSGTKEGEGAPGGAGEAGELRGLPVGGLGQGEREGAFWFRCVLGQPTVSLQASSRQSETQARNSGVSSGKQKGSGDMSPS